MIAARERELRVDKECDRVWILASDLDGRDRRKREEEKAVAFAVILMTLFLLFLFWSN